MGSAGARWAGRAGARRASMLGRAGRQAHGRRQALTGDSSTGRSGRAGARQQARGACVAWALGARPGPVGCSCTRLGFQPGFSTLNFS